ncbi:YvcK family protein [Caldibacillus lycopersici]|uniref:Gluconeogenesis factor n=1 Tax=Perspicuibacillus lycopersici TaxID=1325689 RepID=A0AAE3IT17_9BACI|nr:YvcK family protein [Perspicuibacillus lycopersici]MCU9612921.1 YvcK family protein [Perspicuibacillus lycopersici]
MTKQNQPSVVVIGGGTGLPVLLRGIKRYPVDITAIVTVADDGGSSGRLREDLRIPPPGDIRNVLAALSEVEPLIEEMFQHRFDSDGELSGHSLGNLILAAMTNITGNFALAVHETSRVLNVKGRVLPSANQSVVLHAEMKDGTVVEGESKIPLYGQEIKRVFLTPENIRALPDTIKAIRKADLIVIAPGSLYTSILPNLLVPDLGKEVQLAKAKKVYICNLMTQAGETNGFTASDHVKALYDHIGYPFLQSIIINDGQIPETIKMRYKGEDASPVVFDKENLLHLGLEVISDTIVTYDEGYIRHDTKKLSEIIYNLVLDESFYEKRT